MILGTFAAFLVAVPAFASPPTVSSKRAEAQQVLQQINQLNSSLDRADEMLNLANIKLARVGRQIKSNQHLLRIARANLQKSRATIAQRLVSLYVNGEPSTLEVILGANSLDDILSRADAESRVSALDHQVIGQVQSLRAAVNRHARALALERRQTATLVAQRRTQQNAIAAHLGERRRLLSSLNSEIQRLIAAQLAAQQAAAARQAEIARAQAATIQAAQHQLVAATPIGATAQAATGSSADPSAATVVPPSTHSDVVGIAMSFLGTPYVWGGAAPGGFDCSGLVMYAYAQIGISLPHSSYAQWNYGVPVSRDQLQPGDIVFFDGLGHEGMYIGGGQFIHAPHTGTVVQISSMDGWASAAFVGARRIQ